MASLLGFNNVGTLKVINLGDDAAFGTLTIGDGDGGDSNFSENMIVTAWKCHNEANVEYVPTLSRHFYIYAFGHRAGRVAVTGFIGKDHIRTSTRYYAKNNINDNKEPVTIAIGSYVFNGFLDKFSLDDFSEIVGISRFQLSFTTLIDEAGKQ